MNYAISVELHFFLISILWGIMLLLAYDVLRVFRRLIKHGIFFVALEDLIFWVCASLFIFAMMYEENDGIIRGFSIMGMSLGMVLYHYILSDFIVNNITKLIRTLLSPIVFVLNKIKKIIKLIFTKVKRVSKLLIIRLKKGLKSVRIALNKRKETVSAKKQLRSDEKRNREEEKASKKNKRKASNKDKRKASNKDKRKATKKASKKKAIKKA